MPHHFLSNDLKLHIPFLFQDGLMVDEICQNLSVSKTLVYRILKLWESTKSVQPPPPMCQRVGWPCILPGDAIAFIETQLNNDGTLLLCELQEQIHKEFGLNISISTLRRTLNSILFTCKQVTKIEIERNELLCVAFKCHFADLVSNINMLICIDESSKDEQTVACWWGYAQLGRHCPVCTWFVWGFWYSILPVLGIDGYLAVEIYEGPVTSEQFIIFLCEHVVSIIILSLATLLMD